MSPRSADVATVLEKPIHPEPRFDGVEDESVARFLRRHRHLRPLLDDLRREIDAHFGPGAPVILELATDPEEGDTALFARIRTELPVDHAMDRLDAIFDAWWLDNLPRAQGFLHIDVGQ